MFTLAGAGTGIKRVVWNYLEASNCTWTRTGVETYYHHCSGPFLFVPVPLGIEHRLSLLPTLTSYVCRYFTAIDFSIRFAVSWAQDEFAFTYILIHKRTQVNEVWFCCKYGWCGQSRHRWQTKPETIIVWFTFRLLREINVANLCYVLTFHATNYKCWRWHSVQGNI